MSRARAGPIPGSEARVSASAVLISGAAGSARTPAARPPALVDQCQGRGQPLHVGGQVGEPPRLLLDPALDPGIAQGPHGIARPAGNGRHHLPQGDHQPPEELPDQKGGPNGEADDLEGGRDDQVDRLHRGRLLPPELDPADLLPAVLVLPADVEHRTPPACCAP